MPMKFSVERHERPIDMLCPRKHDRVHRRRIGLFLDFVRLLNQHGAVRNRVGIGSDRPLDLFDPIALEVVLRREDVPHLHHVVDRRVELVIAV